MQAKDRPNLIYIVSDQLRYDACGYTGNTKAHTPNIDKLAALSVNFTNCTSSTPVCAAYRASLFTGKYASSTGMVINESCINPNHKALAYCLNDAGYDLSYRGKWHLVDEHDREIPNGPARLGFQHGSWKAYNFNHRNLAGYYWEDDKDGMPQKHAIKGFQDDYFTQETIKIINNKNPDNPFAIFLNFSAPHDPWVPTNVPEKHYEKFKSMSLSNPVNFLEMPDRYADRFNKPDEWERYKRELENYSCFHFRSWRNDGSSR